MLQVERRARVQTLIYFKVKAISRAMIE